jgi:Heavy-metal resistance protein CzcE
MNRYQEYFMKIKTPSLRILAGALAFLALTSCVTRTDYVNLYGQPSPVAGADRMIVITPSTRFVNVEGGQTVAFIIGDKQFAWNFFVARTVTHFPLNDVAPPGILDHPVQTYVSPDPRYFGTGG